MKANIFLLVIIGLFFSGQSSGQSCTRFNDIKQTANNGASLSSRIGHAQSWEANCDGQIESFAIRTEFIAGTGQTINTDIYILEGNTATPGSTILKNFNYSFVDAGQNGQNHIIEIPGLLNVMAGQEYSFAIIQTAEDISFQYSTNNPYIDGNYSRFSDLGDPWNQLSTWDLDFDIIVKDDPPFIGCRNITLTLDANGQASTSFGALSTGSGDDLGVVFRTISQSNFTCDDVGSNEVELFIQDTGGQNAFCDAIVTVIDGTAPELTCPGDITVGVDPGITEAIVTYTDIMYSDCTVETPAGFSFLGVYTDPDGDIRNYYLSDNTIELEDGENLAEALGGFLVTVIDEDHNNWIRRGVNFLTGTDDVQVLLGYTDRNNEGPFFWHAGNENAGYENWNSGEPNNSGDEDFAVQLGNGLWNDLNRNQERRYLLQLPPSTTSTITQTTGLASGSSFPLGTTTNTFEAVDANGNNGTCSFNVTVEINPYETSVVLNNGKLTITDIENDSDDQITISSVGTSLVISNLVLPTVSGGPTLTNETTVSVLLSSITSGIEFIGNNGSDTVNFDTDLTLTGSDNDITLSGLGNGGDFAFRNNGHIDIEGDFTISDSSDAFVLLKELTANNLSITNVNRIRDVISPSPITISGQTDLQATSGIDLIQSATHTFSGLVNLESNSISFYAIGPLQLGTVNTTGGSDNLKNYIRVDSGNLELSDNVTTAGSSDLRLKAQTTMNQTGGVIITDVLTLEGDNNGETTAFLHTDNDVNTLETYANGSMGIIVLIDIDDLAIGKLIMDTATLSAPDIIFTEDTHITKNDTPGGASIEGNISMTSDSSTSSTEIYINGGAIYFDGATIDLTGHLEYTAVSGSVSDFAGEITFPNTGPFTNLEFGILQVDGSLFVGDAGMNILDDATITTNLGVLSGVGVVSGGPITIENDASLTPGKGTDTNVLTTANLEINGGVFAPFIDSDSAFDQVSVAGTVVLTDAEFAPTGDFTFDTGNEEPILIQNDGSDAIVGIFNNYPEGSQVSLPGTSETFRISYEGGDGNDLTLFRDNTAPTISCPSDLIIDCSEGVMVEHSGENNTVTNIPDDNDNGITSVVTVSGINPANTVVDITVDISLTHTWVGDLDIDLVAPDGEIITLIDESLNDSSNLEGDFPLLFTDTATVSSNDLGDGIENNDVICRDNSICSYYPSSGQNGFNQFVTQIISNGTDFNGTWTLIVRDRAGGDLGTVNNWKVTIQSLDPNLTPNIDTDPSVTGMATATDSCGTSNCNVSISYEDSVVSGCGITEVITRTWTATDDTGNESSCVQTITITDTTAPIIDSCPEDIVVLLSGGTNEVIVNYDLPTATDFCGDVMIVQTEGLASGELFPEGVTTNTFSITDECSNETICSFDVIVGFQETQVALDAGKLTITDVNGGTSDDNIAFSNDGTILTISNLVSLVSVSGGPILTDDTTVTVPLASITHGIEFNGGDGFNSITFENDLTLTGVENDITLIDLNDYTQNGSINIEGDFTISNGFGFDLLLGELTVNNLTINGVDKILDQELALTITGVTQLQALDGIDIDDGQSRHNFGGEVNLTAGQVAFTAGANTTFGSVMATDIGGGLINELTVSPGNIIFNGNVSISDSNANLFVCGNSNISQTSGIIQAPFLILRGNGTTTTATLNNDNEIQALATTNPFDPNALDLVSLSFTNSNNMYLEVIHVNEFDVTAPVINFEPNFTEITKEGTGVSNFNGKIDVNSGSGTVRVNHNAGTINFNGESNDFESLFTYNGLAGTITNINSLTTDFPFGGPNRSFTFGTLNGSGAIDIGDIQLNILDGANFSGSSTLLTGFPFISGGPTVIENGATITPSAGPVGFGLSYNFDDLSMVSGAIFAPLVEGTASDEHDRLNVNGTVTLIDAVLAPIGGYMIQADDEIIIIDNDAADAVNGIFENLPEGSGVSFGDFVGMISYVGGDGNDVVLVPDTIDPIALCQNLAFEVGLGGVEVNASEIDNGSSDNVGIASILIDGETSIQLTYDDLGDTDVTITVTDTSGNTAECTATITLTSGVTLPILISEYQPVISSGTTQEIEIIGNPGESFAGTFVVIDGDPSSNPGLVQAAYNFSGIFDSNGLLTATVPDIPNPTHTAVLTSSFTGTVGNTDVDSDDDGIIDDTSDFGLLLDAVGIANSVVCCPFDIRYGTEFGGVDIPFIGGSPSAIFRLGSVGGFYQISISTGTIYDDTGSIVDASIFNITPTPAGTFGSINPVRLNCFTQTTWDGTTWDNGLPNASTGAIIESDLTTSPTFNLEACELRIKHGATLTINANEYALIQNDIEVENGGSIVVAHQGSIVQVNDDASAINNGMVNVNITTPNLKPRDFMVMGSPMTTETRSGVYTNAFRVLNHTTSNFMPHPDVTAQFPLAENFADDNGDDWTTYSGTINPGEGYLVYPQPNITSGNTTYDLTYQLGTLNNGIIDYNVEFNADKNSSPNVLANPYASAISATDFINGNAMINEVYFWEHLTTPNNNFPGYNTANFSMEDISMRNLMGGVAAASDPGGTTQPNDLIATGQGFGIKANAAGTASFSNHMRRTTGNNTLRAPEETDRIWLKVSSDQYEMQGSTLIGFSENASAGIDLGYDSRRLASIVSLYTHLEDGTEELGIQSREVFNQDIQIPMGFSTLIEADVSYRISITAVEGANIGLATVYLIDHQEHVTTNLSDGDYEFISVKGSFNNRFTIVFEQDPILNVNDPMLSDISVYPNPASDYIILKTPAGLSLKNAKIYDITGRLIREIDLSEENTHTRIDISTLKSATYILVIKSLNGEVVKKIVKS